MPDAFIAPEGTPPNSDEWQRVGFAEIAQWTEPTDSERIARELARDVRRTVLGALVEADESQGLRLHHVVISREQYQILEDEFLNQRITTWSELWAAGNIGRSFFGADLLVLPPEIPPPPGYADARPEQRWTNGQIVAPVEELAVSEAVATDEQMIARLREIFLNKHRLPHTWPCRTTVSELDDDGRLYKVTFLPVGWIVGAHPDRLQWASDFFEVPTDSPVAHRRRMAESASCSWAEAPRGRREGEAWRDYIDRISSTAEMDALLGDISDSMSMTYDGTEGEYPF